MGSTMNTVEKTTNLGLVFVANNDAREILSCTSSNATSWSGSTKANQASSVAPAACLFRGRFWMVFVADNDKDQLLLCTSADGKTWSGNAPIGQKSEVAPSLCVFDNRLYLAFIAANDSHDILVCSTADGLTWSSTVKVGQTSRFAPSLCVHGGRLWLAFVASNDSQELLVCSTADGKSWSGNTKVNQSTKGAPSLCAFNKKLWLAFVANNSSEDLLICSSDGGAWSNNTKIGQASKLAPSLAAIGDKLYLAFISNDSKKEVLVCSSTNGTQWSANTKIGQTSRAAPTLFVQELTKGTVRPKYQVITVVYTPPGTAGGNSQSSVVYSDSSSAGTTNSISSSVQEGVEVVAKVGSDAVASGKASFGYSNTTSDTSTLDITKRDSTTLTFPGPAVDGIDHDRDVFYLWLNPLYIMTVDQLKTAVWATDIDGNEMKVTYVHANWLKQPSTMPPGTKDMLDAAKLTLEDYEAILAHNPYTRGATTIDPNRYMSTGRSFAYNPPYDAESAPLFSTYQHENTIDRSRSRTSEVQYTVSATFAVGMPDIWSVETTTSLSLTNSNTFGTSSSKTQSATVNVGGPSYGYTGPVDVLVYWDTVYNTFMFAFANQAPDVVGAAAASSGQAVVGAPVTLRVGDTTLQTYTDTKGEYRFYNVPKGEAKVTVGGGTGTTATTKSLKSGVTLSS